MDVFFSDNLSYNPLFQDNPDPGNNFEWVYYNYTTAGSYTLALNFTEATTVYFFVASSGQEGQPGVGVNVDSTGGFGGGAGSFKTGSYTSTTFNLLIALGRNPIYSSSIVTDINNQININVPNGINYTPSLSNVLFNDGKINDLIRIGGYGGTGGAGQGNYIGDTSTSSDSIGGSGGAGGVGGGGSINLKLLTLKYPTLHVGASVNGQSGNVNRGEFNRTGGDGGAGFNFEDGGISGGGGGGGGASWSYFRSRHVLDGVITAAAAQLDVESALFIVEAAVGRFLGDAGNGGLGGIGAVMIYYKKIF